MASSITVTGTYYTRPTFDSFETDKTKCALIRNKTICRDFKIDLTNYTLIVANTVESHNDIHIAAKTVILFAKLQAVIGRIFIKAERLYLFNTELISPFDLDFRCTDVLVSESEPRVTDIIKQIFLSDIPGQPGCHLMHGLIACYFNLFGETDDKLALYHFDFADRPAPPPVPSPSSLKESLPSLADSMTMAARSFPSSPTSPCDDTDDTPSPSLSKPRYGGGGGSGRLTSWPVFPMPDGLLLDDPDDDTTPTPAVRLPPAPTADARDPALEALLSALRNHARHREEASIRGPSAETAPEETKPSD